MPQLDATRSYTDGAILFAADLDAIIDDIETLLNTTGLDDDNIQNEGITASTKLVDASISTGKIASSAVTTAKINDLAVTTAKINDLAVTTAKIDALSVTAAKVAADAVTTAKILDANVTAAKLASDAVTTAKVLDSNVTTAKIADSAVTTAKINDGAVTAAKRSSAAYAIASSSSSATIAATGRPVLVMVMPNGNNQGSLTSVSSGVTITLSRDSSPIASWAISAYGYDNGSGVPETFPSSFCWLDVPSAGSRSYSVSISGASFSQVQIAAVEL